jgi:hypothetical protein
MKKYLVLALAIIAGLLFLAAVVTTPQSHDWNRIFNGTIGANGDGFDTTSAFSIKGWDGVITVIVETDTTGASVASGNQSDSCLTVFLQLHRKYVDAGDQSVENDWMGYYSSTDVNKTRVDSIARSFVNAAGNTVYMNPAAVLSSNGEWGWADSARFVLGIGVGDSLTGKIDVGGQ